jgi:hypothetical protein
METELILPLDALDAMEFLDGAQLHAAHLFGVGHCSQHCARTGQVIVVNQSRLCFHGFCVAGTDCNSLKPPDQASLMIVFAAADNS